MVGLSVRDPTGQRYVEMLIATGIKKKRAGLGAVLSWTNLELTQRLIEVRCRIIQGWRLYKALRPLEPVKSLRNLSVDGHSLYRDVTDKPLNS